MLGETLAFLHRHNRVVLTGLAGLSLTLLF